MTLAEFFNKQREIIEAAETPFAKLAIFILPIMAPVVPAALTGLHLYKLFQTIFTFKYANEISAILSVFVALVLEMLGYVGAISFIQSVFRLIKTRNGLYLLPSVLNGLAYAFYLLVMFLVNYMLGDYFQTPEIVNTTVALLSFMTVPTSLLAANHLSQREMKEDDRELRRESREERLEKARIRAGKVTSNLLETSQTYQKVTGKLPEQVETFQQVSTDWRHVSPLLSEKQKLFIATNEPKDIVKECARLGKSISPRTASNWREYAKKELGIR